MKRKSIVNLLIFTLSGTILLTVVTTAVYLFLNNKYGVPDSIINRVNELVYELQGKGYDLLIRTEAYKETYCNIIMLQTEEDEKTECFVLEAVNAASGKELFITIPGSARITMSNSLYVELQGEVPAIPQIIMLENVIKHAGTEKGPLYVQKILEDFLGISIDYYTVMPKEAFYELFTIENNIAVLSGDAALLMELPVTKRRTMEIFSKIYALEGFKTNMSYKDKCRYLEYYEGLELLDIITCVAEGKNMNEAFIIDAVKLGQVINKHIY